VISSVAADPEREATWSACYAVKLGIWTSISCHRAEEEFAVWEIATWTSAVTASEMIF